MTSPASGNSAFPQPKRSSASHLSSYLRKLLSCLHTQGSNCTLTLLQPHTCCCHGNGRDATGMTAAWLGTGGDHGQAPRGGAAGEPPLAKSLNETPTSNSKTLPDGGREGDHWRPPDVYLGSNAAPACLIGSTEKSLITLR